jgi:hypothetical protein
MPGREQLPISDYDSIAVSDLVHRIRSLDRPGLTAVVQYERDHAGRPAVLVSAEARMKELRDGARPSGGDPDGSRLAPPAPSGGSPVSPETSGPPVNPPSQGVPSNPAQPR